MVYASIIRPFQYPPLYRTIQNQSNNCLKNEFIQAEQDVTTMENSLGLKLGGVPAAMPFS